MSGKQGIRKFFLYDQNINKSTCTICGETVTGNHVTNLKKHIRAKHKEEYAEFEAEEKANLKRKREDEEAETANKKFKQETIRSTLLNEVTVKINLKTIIESCVALIVNGRPLVLRSSMAPDLLDSILLLRSI